MVRDEYHKARLFTKGLKHSIRRLIASQGTLIFDVCLDRAQIV